MDKNIYVERRDLATSGMTELAADMVLHMYARRFPDYTIVVAAEPFLLLRVVRKQWLKLLRTVQRERSKTLNARRIAQLSQDITRMQELRFATKTPDEEPLASVFFIKERQLSEMLPPISTCYISPEMNHEPCATRCEQILQAKGLLVTYRITPPPEPKKSDAKLIF
ncbi:MAG TPA: hypothetical protein VLF60_03400 [Candidatus Saccharimonadales bacterium]|nr:hypothetical protein [Candidatus Saccharimonadales bacterium]